MVDLTEEEKKSIVDLIDGILDGFDLADAHEAVSWLTLLRKLDRIDLADEWAIELGLP
jgi:hypothetical protein